jgi:hypothetical protein
MSIQQGMKLLFNGRPDGREDKIEQKLDPKTCAR